MIEVQDISNNKIYKMPNPLRILDQVNGILIEIYKGHKLIFTCAEYLTRKELIE